MVWQMSDSKEVRAAKKILQKPETSLSDAVRKVEDDLFKTAYVLEDNATHSSWGTKLHENPEEEARIELAWRHLRAMEEDLTRRALDGASVSEEKKELQQQQEEQQKPVDRRTHRARIKERKSYLSPARDGKITIAAHAEPELKDALQKKFEESGFEYFNDFLVSSLKRIAEEPSPELKPTTELAKAALHQSRELQKTINALSQDLSTRTR